MPAAIHMFLFTVRKIKLIPSELLEIFELFGNCNNTCRYTNPYKVSYKIYPNLPIIVSMKYTICVNISLYLRPEKECTQMHVILEKKTPPIIEV